MAGHALEAMQPNSTYIPDLHHYCDRWCARCPLSQRCSFYASLLGDAQSPPDKPFTDSFWKEFQTVLNQALQTLARIAKEKNLDIASDRIEVILEEGLSDASLESQPLLQMSQRYAHMAATWLHAEQPAFAAWEQEYAKCSEIGIEEGKASQDLHLLRDAVEVIEWYQHQIHAKLKQAFATGNASEQTQPPSLQRDGIAKVALIGMDRSIAAWVHLCELFPDKSDSILTVLLQMDRLRRETETAFPEARSFQRPGFED